MLCARCALRFPDAARCPVCGAEALLDLRTSEGRASAEQRLTRPSALGRVLRRWVDRRVDTVVMLASIIVATLLAMAVAMITGHMLAYFAAYLLVPVLGTLAWVLLWPALVTRVTRPKVRRRIAVHRPEHAPSQERTTLSGTVRGEPSLTAPLSGTRCVAVRLVGRVGKDEVDDVLTTDLEIALDGADARVELAGACFELTVGRPERVEVGPAIAEALARAGVTPRGREVFLAEGVLLPDARVTIEGVSEEEIKPDGYRGGRAVRVLKGGTHAPLRVREAL